MSCMPAPAHPAVRAGPQSGRGERKDRIIIREQSTRAREAAAAEDPIIVHAHAIMRAVADAGSGAPRLAVVVFSGGRGSDALVRSLASRPGISLTVAINGY